MIYPHPPDADRARSGARGGRSCRHRPRRSWERHRCMGPSSLNSTISIPSSPGRGSMSHADSPRARQTWNSPSPSGRFERRACFPGNARRTVAQRLVGVELMVTDDVRARALDGHALSSASTVSGASRRARGERGRASLARPPKDRERAVSAIRSRAPRSRRTARTVPPARRAGARTRRSRSPR